MFSRMTFLTFFLGFPKIGGFRILHRVQIMHRAQGIYVYQ